MATETSVSTDSEERLRNLNTQIVTAVTRSEYWRLAELLAEHRAFAIALAPELTPFAKAEVRATIQQAILIATFERAHLQQLLNECQSRAAVIAAYSPAQTVSPVGDVRA